MALLALLLIGAGSAWGETVTFDYSDYTGKGTTSTGSEYTMVKDDVTIGDTKFYGNNNYAHFYAGGVTTITPSENVTITGIVLTASAENYNGYQSSGTVTASTGNMTKNGTTVTWSGSATSAFTISHSKQIRWTSIVVTYSKAPADTRTDVTLEFSETEITLKKGDAFVAPTFTKTPADLEGVVFSSSYPAVATVSDAGVIALGGATGTAVITATFEETDEYKGAQASVTITVNDGDPIVEPTPAGKYVKVTDTDDIVDGQYLIVYEAGNVAFNGALETLDAESNTIDVTIDNNEITATAATTAAEFTIDVTNGTLLSASGNYIGVSSNSNALKQTGDAETYTHTFEIDDDGNAVITAVFEGSTMTLRYNSASNQNRFRYYKNSGQKAIQLYKYVAGESVDEIDIAVSSAGFATYVSNFDLDYSGVEGLFAYKAQVSGDKISFTKVDKVPAGEGVLLRATNGGTKFTVPTTTSVEDLEGNLFVRGTGAAVDSEADGKKNYILNIVDDKIGFYRAAGQTVATNRAYLSTTVSTARIALSFDDETTGIAIIDNGQLTIDNSVYDLQGRRVAQPQKGLYIVNGKKVFVK